MGAGEGVRAQCRNSNLQRTSVRGRPGGGDTNEGSGCRRGRSTIHLHPDLLYQSLNIFMHTHVPLINVYRCTCAFFFYGKHHGFRSQFQYLLATFPSANHFNPSESHFLPLNIITTRDKGPGCNACPV